MPEESPSNAQTKPSSLDSLGLPLGSVSPHAGVLNKIPTEGLQSSSIMKGRGQPRASEGWKEGSKGENHMLAIGTKRSNQPRDGSRDRAKDLTAQS